MTILKQYIKTVYYYSGLLSLVHYFRNRKVLTVVLFHRVLPVDNCRWKTANKEWTVSCTFFENCIKFFKKHYNIISLKDLQKFANNEIQLPQRPLLITFDDGWADNAESAAIILEKYNARALLFVTLSAINTTILSWREALYCAWKGGVLSEQHVKKIIKEIRSVKIGNNFNLKHESFIMELQHELENTDAKKVKKIEKCIFKLVRKVHSQNQMMNREQLNTVFNVMDFGTHGIYHEPINCRKNPEKDLKGAKLELEKLLDKSININSLSFPHNKFNKKILKMATRNGYKFLFCGPTVLNPLKAITNKTIIGRCNISQPELSDKKGNFKGKLLAQYLFRLRHGKD